MRIDLHHHWMPEAHYHRLEDFLGPNETLRRADDRAFIFREGVQQFQPTDLYCRIEEQIRDMDAAGVDMAVMHIGLWQDWNDHDLCREIHRVAAEIQRAHPDRFLMLAHVPQDGSKESVTELRKAVQELGLKGVGLNTHVRGVPLDDPSLESLYQAINELNVPVVVHPAPVPRDHSLLVEYGLTGGLGRALELTTITTRILYSGLLGRYPNLRFVMGHLGGAFFALKNRIDPDYFFKKHLAKESVVVEDVDFGEELLSRIYYDTGPAVWGETEIECAVRMVGEGQILMGTDYPVEKDWLSTAVDLIERLPLPSRTRNKIAGENAARLFGLD